MDMKHAFVRLLLPVILGSGPAWAHAGHKHGEHAAPPPPEKSATPPATQRSLLEKINGAYQATVKPIFDRKCQDCHGDKPSYPWYYILPGVGSYIDADIAEAKRHIDFSKGFPFAGHGTVPEDLQAIEEDITKGSMPPFRYWALHPTARLNADDKKAILDWAREAREIYSRENSAHP